MAGKLVKGLAWGGFVVGCALVKSILQQSRHWELSEKVVLITGGSRGLGRAMAREFAAYGARVAVCARDEEDLARVREEFSSRGDHFFSAACDVWHRDQVQSLLSSVEKALGLVDVLVNNAGTILVGPLEHMTVQDFEDVMRVNFWCAIHTTLAALPGMRRRGQGRIVNITSIGGKVAFPHLLPYTASKFALVGFSEGLRAELAKDGISVTTVFPDWMRTGSPRNAEFKGNDQQEYAWFTITDSLPGASMRAERAARQIVRACQNGESEVVLGLPAKLAVIAKESRPDCLATCLPPATNGCCLRPPAKTPGAIKATKARVPRRGAASLR